MNSSYEPKCDLEQSKMLYKLGLREYKPTILLAKNWLFSNYGIWIQNNIIRRDYITVHEFRCSHHWGEMFITLEFVGNDYPQILLALQHRESQLLTKILERLIQNLKP